MAGESFLIGGPAPANRISLQISLSEAHGRIDELGLEMVMRIDHAVLPTMGTFNDFLMREGAICLPLFGKLHLHEAARRETRHIPNARIVRKRYEKVVENARRC